MHGTNHWSRFLLLIWFIILPLTVIQSYPSIQFLYLHLSVPIAMKVGVHMLLVKLCCCFFNTWWFCCSLYPLTSILLFLWCIWLFFSLYIGHEHVFFLSFRLFIHLSCTSNFGSREWSSFVHSISQCMRYSYSISHLQDAVTTCKLDSDSEVTVANCRQHGDYSVTVLPTVNNDDYTITVHLPFSYCLVGDWWNRSFVV